MKLEITLPWPPTTKPCAGIYRIDDVDSGCFYIGSAVDLRQRFKHHVYSLERGKHSNQRLQRIWAINPNRLTFTVIKEMPGAARIERLAAEQEWLDASAVGKNKNCLNMLAVAGSHQGAKRSDESKARLSASLRGRKFSDETKAKMRTAKLGKPLSEAHKRSLIPSRFGRQGPKPTQKTLDVCRKYDREQIINLRSSVASGVPLFTASKAIGISRATARRVIAGQSYKDVK